MTFQSNEALELTLRRMAKQGLIVSRTENNLYLVMSYKGAGGLISPKWNIKIYNTGSGVCNDVSVIKDFVGGRLKVPDPSLKLIRVDDAGWGFPLGGVMVGASNGKRVVTDIVDVSFFKPGPFDRKDYLEEYAKKGTALIQREFKTSPESHRIEICTGYINIRLRESLRTEGYHVRVVEIKGLLQDTLEDLFKKYIMKITGKDIAYDPKGLIAKDISIHYYKAVEWGKKNAPYLLKTGWKTFR